MYPDQGQAKNTISKPDGLMAIADQLDNAIRRLNEQESRLTLIANSFYGARPEPVTDKPPNNSTTMNGRVNAIHDVISAIESRISLIEHG